SNSSLTLWACVDETDPGAPIRSPGPAWVVGSVYEWISWSRAGFMGHPRPVSVRHPFASTRRIVRGSEQETKGYTAPPVASTREVGVGVGLSRRKLVAHSRLNS